MYDVDITELQELIEREIAWMFPVRHHDPHIRQALRGYIRRLRNLVPQS